MKCYLFVILVLCVFKSDLLAQDATMEVLDSTKNSFEICKFPINDNFIAISPLPEKKYLEVDLESIAQHKITTVISLVSSTELKTYGLEDFFERLKSKGIASFHFPIEDFGVPSDVQMDSIYAQLIEILDRDENILIHCKGGLGRSGTVLAAFVKNYLQVEEPIKYVRKIRGQKAIENQQQEKFIDQYYFKRKN